MNLAGSNPLAQVLLALACVILLGQLLARLMARIGQPPVIGEVIAGVLLGPSLLGPALSARILPAEAAPLLGLVAQLGIVLYMFIVGLELRGDLLRRRALTAVVTSNAGIIVPFVSGTLLSLWLYPHLAPDGVPFRSFALFMGIAMSITAFPVLARILTDRGMQRTELGTLALGCAAADDVTAWCLLALVTGIARSEIGGGLVVLAAAIAFIAIMLLVIRPIAARLVSRWQTGPTPRQGTALIMVALLLAALAAERIGIHAVFGAFLLGAVIPHDSDVAKTLSRVLEPVVTLLLLPAFFALTGMRTRIDLLQGTSMWLMCGAIILVATLGKFGGAYAAARLTGLGRREAAALGALMNTRGLMELVVLNVGLDLGIISPPLFAMMVLMALATTLMTAPALDRLVPQTNSQG